MNYLRKQKRKYDFFAILATGLILTVGIYYSIQAIEEKKWTETSMEVWTGVIIGILIMLLYLLFKKIADKKFDEWMEQSANYGRGIVGEMKVFEKLQKILPKDHVIITSVVTGKYGDADIVTIGPKGVIVFEVKNWSNDVFIKNGKIWLKKQGGKQWNLMEKNPFAQVKGQCMSIDTVLKESNLFVERSIPVVIFINNVQWNGELRTLVSDVNNLDKVLDYITDKPTKYNKEVIQKIAQKLKEFSTS